MKIIISKETNENRQGTLLRLHRSGYGMLIGVLIAVLLPAAVSADDDGRYKAIVLHQGGSYSQSAALSPKVFILDSRDGHMWTWEQNAQLKDAQGNLQFGTMTVYQGKLKVGSRSGEVVDQSR